MFILSCIIMLRLTFQSRRFSFSACGSRDSCSVSWPISFFPSFIMWLYEWTLLLNLIPSFLRRRCKERNPTSKILDRIPFGWHNTACSVLMKNVLPHYKLEVDYGPPQHAAKPWSIAQQRHVNLSTRSVPSK